MRNQGGHLDSCTGPQPRGSITPDSTKQKRNEIGQVPTPNHPRVSAGALYEGALDTLLLEPVDKLTVSLNKPVLFATSHPKELQL